MEYAGVLGFEPRLTVLETVVLAIDTTPPGHTKTQLFSTFLFSYLPCAVCGRHSAYKTFLVLFFVQPASCSCASSN